MGIALVTITSTGYGESWQNTWGVRAGNDSASPITDSELLELIEDSELTNATTSPATDNPAYEGATSVLAAIIGFHRHISYSTITIANIYVSDGRKNADDSVFFTQPLGFPGQQLVDAGDSGGVTVPLSIAWHIARKPGGFSQKPGRLYMRGCLTDASVRPGTRTGVQWQSNASATAYANLLALAVTESAIGNWFNASVEPDSNSIGIPHYGTASLNEGQLLELRPISGLSSVGPTSRQLTRGRRRSTTP